MATRPVNQEPFSYRPHRLAKNERNQALIADYLGGMTAREVAAKYQLTYSYAKTVLHRRGITLPSREHARRSRLGGSTSGGRPPVWPDCPPELQADYAILSKYHGKIRARAMLDPGERP